MHVVSRLIIPIPLFRVCIFYSARCQHEQGYAPTNFSTHKLLLKTIKIVLKLHDSLSDLNAMTPTSNV